MSDLPKAGDVVTREVRWNGKMHRVEFEYRAAIGGGVYALAACFLDRVDRYVEVMHEVGPVRDAWTARVALPEALWSDEPELLSAEGNTMDESVSKLESRVHDIAEWGDALVGKSKEKS